MSDWTKEQLRAQLHHAKADDAGGKSLYEVLHDAAARERLAFELVLAVASRESGIRNIKGDGGRGFGPMQLDDRSHHIPATWRTDPAGIVLLCCELLTDLLAWARGNIPTGADKVALSAYNCGQHNALRGHARGDSDRYTTGFAQGNGYGRDVLARSKAFSEILAGD